MRSYSWEFFVGAILLFFVAILVSNEKEAEERRDRRETRPSITFEKSISNTIEKSIQAANEAIDVARAAVEASRKAAANKTRAAGQTRTKTVVTAPQNLHYTNEQTTTQQAQKIKQNTTCTR